MNNDKWIWLDKNLYPDSQTTVKTGFSDKANGNYTVAEFKKNYKFSKKIKKIFLRFSADTEFRLYCNGELIATGPANPGGDFFAADDVNYKHYAFEAEFETEGLELDFFARVKMMPVYINEFSKCHGGFMLSARVIFEDESEEIISTDKTWLSRKNSSYTAPNVYDGSILSNKFSLSEEIEDIWQCETAPIPVREEHETEINIIKIPAGSEKETVFSFDKIYGGFIGLKAEVSGRVEVKVLCLETDTANSTETFVFTENTDYIGLQLRSIGGYRVIINNQSGSDAKITLSVIETYYPIEYCANTVTSDKELDKLLNVCKNSLKYCRQMMHLDSPLHSEPHACTGDYYIEMLMTAFSYGDMRLSEFDIRRTAEILRAKKGVMFHTTYSLIWIQMLFDGYMLTGHKDLLEDCEDALLILLNRFEGYIGDTGLIENPPNYAFVDWLVVDDFSIHHPPKALGQTCLNMFYYGGLKTAVKIFNILGKDDRAEEYRVKAENLRNIINDLLYDKERGLYFEGLNTPTPENLLGDFMPQNTDKRYYRMHSNILAAYFGVCDTSNAELLERTLTNETLGVYQPYFGHFTLEAVYRCGLSEKFLLPILENWKKSIAECDKGLPEGFYAPEPSYKFDHSHAWAGTPLYALPLALSGIEIVEPGYKQVRLNPKLLGLDFATVEIPTPYGFIKIEQSKGAKPVIELPKEIKLIN